MNNNYSTGSTVLVMGKQLVVGGIAEAPIVGVCREGFEEPVRVYEVNWRG